MQQYSKQNMHYAATNCAAKVHHTAALMQKQPAATAVV